MKGRPDTILLVNIRLIGDVILTTPLIGQLAATFPGVTIDVLVNKGTGDFLREDERVRHVIEVPNKEFRKKTAANTSSQPHYLRQILRRYDWAINMNASDRGTFATVISGRHMRFGFSDDPKAHKALWRRIGLTHHLPFPKGGHIAERCQTVAAAIGLPPFRPQANVRYSPATAAKVKYQLAAAGISTNRYFVVHPFARWAYKLWHAGHFAAVSDWIAAEYNLRPVWTSSPDADECTMLDQAIAATRVQPAVFRGNLSLNGISALLADAQLYLGLDTAVTHIAASHSIPLVALYGPTLLDRWHPWDNHGDAVMVAEGEGREFVQYGTARVVRSQWPCVPCGFASCDDKGGPSPCIKEISIDAVRSAVHHCMMARTPEQHNQQVP